MKATKHQAFFKNIIIVIFLTIISINFMLFFIIRKHDIDSIENKEKLKFPTYDSLGYSGFMTNYEAYFNNHFPYKYAYIKPLNYFKKVLLKSFNANDKVIIGKNGWLFYNSSIYDSLGLNEYCGYYQWNKNQIEQVISNVKTIHHFCIKNKIQFQLLICPSKQSIYSEFLPNYYNKKYDNRYDQLYHAFPEFINLKNHLLAYKKTSTKLLYYKTDTHWNLLAGALTGRLLSQKLQQFFPNIANFKSISIKDSILSVGNDLANMLALKNCYTDTFYRINFNETNKNKIPHLMIVNDSFLEALMPSLNQLFFKITTRQLYTDGIPSPELLLKEKPDVLIIELTERYKELLTGNIHPDYFK